MTKTSNSRLGIFSILFLTTVLNGCSSSITSWFAFHPEKIAKDFSLPERPGMTDFFIKSLDKTRIHCIYFENKKSEKAVLYFHGNSGHAFHRIDDADALCRTGTNVLLIDYRGYGKSDGSPSEKGIYLDAAAALHYLIENKKFALENIIILGRSIGSAVALEMARNRSVRGIILISPLSSGKDMAKHMGLSWFSWVVGKSFDNVDKAKDVLSPVLIIHGDTDPVIPIKYGKKVYESLRVKEKFFITIKDGNHNDLLYSDGKEIWAKIQKFIADPEPSEIKGVFLFKN